MNRIKKAFDNKKAFIGFLTAGDPTLEKTEEFVLEMERGGAALIEQIGRASGRERVCTDV